MNDLISSELLHPYITEDYSIHNSTILGWFEQSYRGSITVTAQGIETQHTPNESLGKESDLPIRHRLYVNGSQSVSLLLLLLRSFFFYFACGPFGQRLVYHTKNTNKKTSVKLYMCTYGLNFGCVVLNSVLSRTWSIHINCQCISLPESPCIWNHLRPLRLCGSTFVSLKLLME